MDGTLVTTNLVHPTLFYLVNQQSPVRSAMRVLTGMAKAPLLAATEMLDRRAFNEKLYALFEGVSVDRLECLADEAFDVVLKRNLYPGAKDLVSRCRDEGSRVVLISGSLDFLMSRLASHLGGCDVIANRLEIHEGYATGKLLRPIVAGPEKARLIREHAKAHGVDLDASFAYSDSASDVPMLSVVGHPAAVNPDRGLARLATVYDWPILRLDRNPD